MEEYIGLERAIYLINRNFGCNINARGELEPYWGFLKDLKLRSRFTEGDLLNAIYNYKQSRLYKRVYENR